MYYLNEDHTLAYFFPSKPEWNKELSPIEHFFSCLFPSGGMYFKGKIDKKRFLDAMQKALNDFNFLFCQLYKDQKKFYAYYSIYHSLPPSIQLEIEKREDKIETSTFSDILPQKIDQRLTKGVADDLEGLSLCAFKLTEYINGFVIGYYINHVFFDQHSTFYFLKYLSHIYTYSDSTFTLKKPYLSNLEPFNNTIEVTFNNLKEMRSYGSSLMGFQYTDKSKPPAKKYNNPIFTTHIIFDLRKISELKNSVSTYISDNDIIHAILLKIYSLNSTALQKQLFCLSFPCNMRKKYGFGEEVIGNMISHSKLLLTTEKIRNSTLIELAMINRKCINKIKIDDFKNNLKWYRGFKEMDEFPLNYMPQLSFTNCRVTNWSTFDYNTIQFDNFFPSELRAPCYAMFGVNVISFDHKNNEKRLRTSISIPSDSMNLLKELEITTSLFTCTEFIEEKNIQIF